MTQDRRSPSDLAAELAKALFGADLPKARTKSGSRSGSSLRKREFEEALTSASKRASVVGRFLPSEVVRGVAQPIAEAVLSSMARDCDVELHGDRRVWMLGRDQRQSILARLYGGRDRSQLMRLLDKVQPHDQPADRGL